MIEDKSTSATQERRQYARGIRILQTRKEGGGSVAPRRNNRITESATKESREETIKAKKPIQRNKRKTTRRQDKTNERGTPKGKGNTENDKKEHRCGCICAVAAALPIAEFGFSAPPSPPPLSVSHVVIGWH